MLALSCPTQSYDWGSTHAIPGFRREDADGSRVAEVWIGTHPLGTARVVEGSGQTRPLTEVSGELGFMLKVQNSIFWTGAGAASADAGPH